MEQAVFNVLLDFEHLTLLTLAVGLLISMSIRSVRGQDLETAKGFGKVRVDCYGGVDLVAVILLLAFYYLSFLSGPRAGDLPPMSIDMIVINLVMGVFLVTIVLVTVQWVGGRDPVELFGLNRVGFPIWLVWVIPGILLSTLLVLQLGDWARSVWLEPVFGEMEEQEIVDSMKNTTGVGLKVGLIVTACLIAPIVEELIFRGYIYGVLKRFSNPLFAMVVAGALFAAVHLNLPALVPLWIFAIILTLTYELSGSLWVPIGIHAGFNTINVFMMLSGGGEGP
jgi:membrane protease YdiL (CAAX protease family)